MSASLPSGMAADLSTITRETLSAVFTSREKDGEVLGKNPSDGRNIRLLIGRYGAYLQLGDQGEEGTTTHSLPRSIGNMGNIDVEKAKQEGFSLSEIVGITYEQAIGYVNLPRTVSILNDLPIIAAIGPYGPYLKYNNTFVSLPEKDGNILNVDAETAEKLVLEASIKGKSKSQLFVCLLCMQILRTDFCHTLCN